MRFTAIGLVVLATCVNTPRERGAAGLFENVPLVKAPPQSRCAKLRPTTSAGKACADSEYVAQTYTRRLSVGDAVCLSGGYGEPPIGSCLARGVVADTATGRVLIDIREAKPDSPYFRSEMLELARRRGIFASLTVADLAQSGLDASKPRWAAFRDVPVSALAVWRRSVA